MAKRLSQRIVRYTIVGIVHREQMIHAQPVETPFGMREPIDAIVIDRFGITHLLEVKETVRDRFWQSNVGGEQRRILTHPRVQPEGPTLTKAWIILRFYNGEAKPQSRQYYDYYFLIPSSCLVRGQSFSLEWALEQHQDETSLVTLLAQRRGPRWDFGMDPRYGISTRDKENPGLNLLLRALETASETTTIAAIGGDLNVEDVL